MTTYDYMCDVLHIEACTDCPNFKNWECIGDYSQGDKQCLKSLNVTDEDIEQWEHPNRRMNRELQNRIRNIQNMMR